MDIQKIGEIVAEDYGITYEVMCSETRKREVIVPRQIAHCLAWEVTRESLAVIGGVIGGKDHATVFHSHNTIRDMMQIYPAFKERVKKIKDIILSEPKDDAPVISHGVAYSFWPKNYNAA